MTIISLGLATGHRCERRLLSSFGLGEQPAGGRIGDCCGEDCPFQPSGPKTETEWFLLLSCPKTRQSGLSTSEDASLAFTRHPRSMQLGLSSGPYRSSDRPSLSLRSVVKVSNETLVPKGRLELPWVAPPAPKAGASASFATSASGSPTTIAARTGLLPSLLSACRGARSKRDRHGLAARAVLPAGCEFHQG